MVNHIAVDISRRLLNQPPKEEEAAMAVFGHGCCCFGSKMMKRVFPHDHRPPVDERVDISWIFLEMIMKQYGVMAFWTVPIPNTENHPRVMDVEKQKQKK